MNNTKFSYRDTNMNTISDKVILGIVNELEEYVYCTLNTGDIDDIAKNIGSKSKRRADKTQDILEHKINGRVNNYLQAEDKSGWIERYS